MICHKHKGCLPPNNIEFGDITSTDIFPTFIIKGKVENIDNQKIINDCLEFSKIQESVSRSNIGGWQSPVYTLDDFMVQSNIPSVADLTFRAVDFANIVAEEIGTSVYFEDESAHFWININDQFDYNVIHSHPKSDLIVLYYPMVEEDHGNLCLVRTDGCAHITLYENVLNGTMCQVTPEVGYFYAFPSHIMHFVEPNMTEKTRMSISFNMTAMG